MGYITEILKRVYEFINPVYAQNERLAKFDELKKLGKLEGMCGSEIEEMFGIKRESPDSEPV